MNDITYYGKTIYYIILYIILIVSIIFIIDEILRMTSFCYNYTYNYNFGKINENLCANDENTGIIEYETARYKIYSNLNKYKFENDLFNKNWINYITYLIIIVLTIIIMISFGTLFYYYFIDNIKSCTTEPTNDDEMSTLKLLIKCTFGKLHLLIPNCTINYILLFIIIIIYPIIIILKSFFKVDYTWNGGNFSKIFHIIICITLLLYSIELLKEKIIESDSNISKQIPITEKYLKVLIYISYIALFYISQYIYKNAYDEYNNQFKGENIYDKEDKNDTIFFDIYKQKEPIKPIKPDILINTPVNSNGKDLLTNFSYCTATELAITPSPHPKCGASKTEYEENLKKLNDYYNTKKDYEKLLKNYNYKYNIYKNNVITFPELITIIDQLVPKFVGFDKNHFIFIYVLTIIFVIIYGILRYNNYSKYGGFEYYYNTIILYLIGLISLLVISNSILTYNTYFNKFHIYEPVSKYKYDITKINTLFDVGIKNIINGTYIEKLNLYKQLTNKQLLNSPSTSTTNPITSLSIDNIIDKIINKTYLITELDTYATNSLRQSAILGLTDEPTKKQKIIEYKIKNAIMISIYSSLLYLKDVDEKKIDSIYITDTGSFITEDDKLLFYKTTNLITSTDIETAGTTKTLTTKFHTFIQILKGTALNNSDNIDNKLNKIKKAIENLIYNEKPDIYQTTNNKLFYSLTPVAGETNSLYRKYLFKNIDNGVSPVENLGEKNDLIEQYTKHLSVINDIINQYGEFLLKVRKITIDLFNSSSVYCDTNINNIDIYGKLNQYLAQLTKNNRNEFKTTIEEEKINLYKKILKNKIDEFNKLYKDYFNVINLIINKNISYKGDDASSDIIFSEVKNNYNVHFMDNERYNEYSFINNKGLKLICNEFISKYTNMKLKEIELIDNNIESVSFGFIVLIIIFAIILLEPIIV